MCDIADTVEDGVAHDSKVAVILVTETRHHMLLVNSGGLVRLITTTVRISWRRTGASADGSRHGRRCQVDLLMSRVASDWAAWPRLLNNLLTFLGRVSRGISDTPLLVYARIPSVARWRWRCGRRCAGHRGGRSAARIRARFRSYLISPALNLCASGRS
jgi:hypothetical protein